MSTQAKKCAHPACNCKVQGNEKYCCDYCHDSGNKLEIACNCHHAECEAGETVSAGGR